MELRYILLMYKRKKTSNTKAKTFWFIFFKSNWCESWFIFTRKEKSIAYVRYRIYVTKGCIGGVLIAVLTFPIYVAQTC